ncbi:Bidirectional sugar transporter SWEET11 [Hondaea fermentalgiana]|uniref:Bidirectional sugar transporter SWEET11 n=1 Tax=Hondaea fermentalgiana TaxID=2315210 RepID=A0A2R5GV68_9STRA|nr:Bidirectional sugar transporter SWEET11 [Hondaea fermentalgiana]|eukprot:GBG34219.1 Bidirectional sugar transporter SWEET11 [Hondaea fermentalgiana]
MVATMVAGSAADIFVSQIAPRAGVVATELLHLGPLHAVLKARRKGSLGNLDPVLFALTTPQSILWCIYGSLSGETYYILGSIGGVVLGMFYLMTVMRLVKDEAQVRRMERFLLVQFVAIAAVVVTSISHKAIATEAAGVVSLISSTALYGTPFFNLRVMFATRDASSINRGFLAMQIISGILWTTYSLFVFDIFVIVNSVVSLAFGLIQLVFVIVFPKPRSVLLVPDEITTPEALGHIVYSRMEDEQDEAIALENNAAAEAACSTTSTPTTSRAFRVKLAPSYVGRTISLSGIDTGDDVEIGDDHDFQTPVAYDHLLMRGPDTVDDDDVQVPILTAHS